MKPRFNPFLRSVSLAASIVLSLGSSTHAATFTWDSNGNTSGVTDGAGTWNTTAGNTVWWDGSANSIWSNTGPNDAVFGNFNGAAGTVAIGTAITVGNLTFNPAGSGQYTLSGAANSAANTLTLSGATPTITANQSATISALVSSANGFVKEGLGSLTLTGSPVDGTVNTIGGTIIVNAGQLVMDGSTNTFGGDGAFQGNLTLANFGRFNHSGANTIGNSAQINVGANAFAQLNNTDSIGAFVGSGRVSFAGTLTLTAGTQNFSGVLSGAGSLVINNASLSQTLSGANLFTGTTTATAGTLALNNVNALQNSTLSKGSGTVTFTVAGTNTYNLGGLSGASALNTGANTISVGGNNANTTYSASIGFGSATGGLAKVGTGTLTLSGASIYTGATTISRGTLVLTGAGSLATSGITFNGTSGFTYTGSATGSSDSVGALTRSAGNGTVTSTYGTSGNVELTFSSLAARASGATANFVVTGGSNGTTNKIVLTGTTVNTFIDQGTFFGGSNYAWYDAAGFVRAINYDGTEAASALTGQIATLGTIDSSTNLKYTGGTGAANAANGASTSSTSLTLTSATGFLVGQAISGTGIAADTYITAVAGDVITLSKAATVADTAAITAYNSVSAQTTGSLNTLVLDGNGASVTLAGSQTLTLNGVLRSGGTSGITGAITGGSGIRASSDADLVVRNNLSSDTLLINTPILANGTNALVKTGAGDLTLGSLAVNTYTGGTFINQGKLIVNQDNNLGSTTAANNIQLNGGTLQPSATFTLNANHGIDVNAGGGTINGNGFQLTLGSANMLSGSGPLTITGSGSTNSVLNSSATQDYTGPMTISSGRIVLGAANITNPYGTGDITIGGASVYVNQSGSIWSNRFFISNAGAESRGAIRAQNGGTFNGDIILTGNATISSDGDGSVTTLNGNISGAFTLSLNGTGSTTTTSKVVLTGNNVHNATVIGEGITNIDHDIALGAYNGTVTINGDGTLQAGAANIILNPDRGVSLSGGTGTTRNIDTGAFNMTIQGVITGASTETLNKQGAGTLTLSNANTFAGLTSISGGTVTAAHVSALSASSSVNISTTTGAGTLRLATDTSVAAYAIGGSSSNQGTIISDRATAGAGITHVLGAAVFGNNTYNIQAGSNVTSGTAAVSFASLNLSAGTAGTMVLNPTTANLIIAGAVNIGANNQPKTLNLGGTSSGNEINGIISNGLNTVTLTKSNSSTWTLSAANSYTGTTTISAGTLQIGAGSTTGTLGSGAVANAGTLAFNRSNTYTLGSGNLITGAGTVRLNSGTVAAVVNNQFNTTGSLTFGASAGATTVAGLDLSNGSGTFGSLLVQTNSSTENTIAIGSGKTLQINGAVTVGYNSAATSATKLSPSGLGTLSIGTSVTPTNANVQIGNGQTTNVSNGATLDMSALSIFYANLGSGTFRVGDPTNAGGTGTAGSTLILAADSTIQAATLTTDSPAGSITNAIKLGSGTNILNVNTLTLGANAIGRANGSLTFNDATGTLKVRSQADPVNGRATLNVGNVTFNTGVGQVGNVFNTNGHSADLMFGTMTIASRTQNSGTTSASFSFDTGTLDANGLIVGNRAAGTIGTSTTSGTVNLGGGTVVFNNTTGPIQLGTNASTTTGSTASGTFNVSGGSVTVAANAGNSFRLGDASVVGGTATGIINLTGGALTVAGDIIRGSATGTSNATVNLKGGTLDMGGNDIGSGGNAITLNAESGTLKNVASINGTDGLTKTTAGTLILDGTNTYTGDTNVSSGALLINGSVSTSTVTTVAAGATLGGSGNMGSAVINGILSPGNSIGTLTAAGDVTWNSNDAWAFELGLSADDLTLANTTPGLSDLLNITGAGNDFLKGTGTGFTFDFGGTGAVGYYKLVDWAGTATTDFLASDFSASNLSSGLTGDFIVDSGTSALYLNVIPEPSALVLATLGSLVLFRRRRV